jgi:hypothetical protein
MAGTRGVPPTGEGPEWRGRGGVPAAGEGPEWRGRGGVPAAGEGPEWRGRGGCRQRARALNGVDAAGAGCGRGP